MQENGTEISEYNGLGQSEYTQLKQEIFRDLLKMHIKIVQSIVKRNTWQDRRYWYFDLTAGPGHYGKHTNGV